MSAEREAFIERVQSAAGGQEDAGACQIIIMKIQSRDVPFRWSVEAVGG